jgi:hypothetical protein
MREQSVKVATGGFPLVSVLTVIFVVAKLMHVISWSWWLVLAGLWAPLVLVFIILIVVLGIGILSAVLS